MENQLGATALDGEAGRWPALGSSRPRPQSMVHAPLPAPITQLASSQPRSQLKYITHSELPKESCLKQVCPHPTKFLCKVGF